MMPLGACLRALLLLSALAVAACAQQPPLPERMPQLALPLQLHVQRRGPDGTRDWILIIQQEDAALRWSLLDPLGVPLARQVLQDGRWQADGLLPPNPEARQLFAALLFALTPSEELERLYQGQQWMQHAGQRTLKLNASSAWQVRYRGERRFDLDVGPALTYGVAPIESAAGAASR
jgi:hypothetical protein